jgi:hypothetical protein
MTMTDSQAPRLAGDTPDPAAAEIRRLKRELRERTKALQDLSGAVTTFLALLDEEMKQPSTPERGKRIAALSNGLDRANDRARYFALGVDWRKDDKDAVRRRAVADFKRGGPQ